MRELVSGRRLVKDLIKIMKLNLAGVGIVSKLFKFNIGT